MQRKFFSKKSLHIRYICGMCMCRAANQKQCPRVKHLVFMSEIVTIMSETCFRLLQASPELVFFLFSGSNSCLKLWLSDLSKSESLLDCITADIINNCPRAEIPDIHVFGLFNIVGMVIMDVIVTPLPTLRIAVCAWECPSVHVSHAQCVRVGRFACAPILSEVQAFDIQAGDFVQLLAADHPHWLCAARIESHAGGWNLYLGQFASVPYTYDCKWECGRYCVHPTAFILSKKCMTVLLEKSTLVNLPHVLAWFIQTVNWLIHNFIWFCDQ